MRNEVVRDAVHATEAHRWNRVSAFEVLHPTLIVDTSNERVIHRCKYRPTKSRMLFSGPGPVRLVQLDTR
jgi:hypothetical protein